MAVKFKNSLLGFNKEDVLKYVYSVKETEAQNAQKIAELEHKLNELTVELNQAQSSLSKAESENVQLRAKTEDFEAREAAITRLSESIGKLYLVAKTNAKSIVNAAKESVELSKAAVDKNIQMAETTGECLSDIENELLATAQKFTAEIESIKQRLNDTKLKVSENNTVIDEKESVMDSLMESVNV